MSVFTPVEPFELAEFLARYDVGRLISLRGIEGGSENSNFFVDCEGGQFVLTLVERGPVAELAFFVALLDCLHEAELPVPYAIADRRGDSLHRFKDRPALLQPRLPGRHVERPDSEHCAAVGDMLGRLHRVTAGCALARNSERGPDWMRTESARWRAQANPLQGALLDEALSALERVGQHANALPTVIVHADLFRDNVLFEAHALTGVIDFYNAATGWALYDLAICVNDWCLDRNCTLDSARTEALLAAYAAHRSFTEAERACWPDMLRVAALRFWLSRLIAAQAHADQPGVLVKDPGHFMQVLQALGNTRPRLPANA